ncbi:MAG: hypothetical protein KDA17_02460 [Candidatus Saccharibacteria bacterium]|nr:hypothetical protein [Candidatus Saccharibacteria bacterium]
MQNKFKLPGVYHVENNQLEQVFEFEAYLCSSAESFPTISVFLTGRNLGHEHELHLSPPAPVYNQFSNGRVILYGPIAFDLAIQMVAIIKHCKTYTVLKSDGAREEACVLTLIDELQPLVNAAHYLTAPSNEQVPLADNDRLLIMVDEAPPVQASHAGTVH